jgi:ribosomal 50S subunit-associated protein YjgA (DUF615 family)
VDPESLQVSTDAVLAIVRAQRNNAIDELAKLEALVQQLVAERDEALAQGNRGER